MQQSNGSRHFYFSSHHPRSIRNKANLHSINKMGTYVLDTSLQRSEGFPPNIDILPPNTEVSPPNFVLCTPNKDSQSIETVMVIPYIEDLK